MSWLLEHAPLIGALCTVMGGIWGFFRALKRFLLRYLSAEFATKQDIYRLDKKLDRALLLAFQVKSTNAEEKLRLL